ncbi:hypothetical protein ACWY4P_31060 [Streptomyces sp. LZ34]
MCADFGTFLVRPDGYVGLAADGSEAAGEEAGLRDYLAGLGDHAAPAGR